MGTFNQAKYIQEYQKQKYDRIVFDVQKGEKEKINKHSKERGYTSMGEYIRQLINDDMKNAGGG